MAHDFALWGLDVYPSYMIVALVLGLGKAFGGGIVFSIGARVEDDIRRYAKWHWFKWLLDKCTWFVSRAGYVGLFLILSLPMMTDTVPLYIFSLMNREGDVFERKFFILTNLLAGISRALVVGILVTFGISAV